MKKLFLGTALAALLASSAFAQSYNPGYGTANSLATSPSWYAQNDVTGSIGAATLDRLQGIRAQAAPTASSDMVTYDDRYVGTDPDANIRFQLHRDPPGLN